MKARLTAVLRSPLLPPALLILILVLDEVAGALPFQIFVTGILDEPAHLATAAVVLLALAGPDRLLRHGTFAVTALLCSMAIDVDHVPLYLGVPHIADDGRPYSHSLSTVLILTLVWLLSGRRWPVLIGAAVGVLLHFVRDVATGPGLQLFWPASSASVLVPYVAYLSVLVVLAIVATGRAVAETRVRSASSAGRAG